MADTLQCDNIYKYIFNYFIYIIYSLSDAFYFKFITGRFKTEQGGVHMWSAWPPRPQCLHCMSIIHTAYTCTRHIHTHTPAYSCTGTHAWLHTKQLYSMGYMWTSNCLTVNYVCQQSRITSDILLQ